MIKSLVGKEGVPLYHPKGVGQRDTPASPMGQETDTKRDKVSLLSLISTTSKLDNRDTAGTNSGTKTPNMPKMLGQTLEKVTYDCPLTTCLSCPYLPQKPHECSYTVYRSKTERRFTT